MGYSHDVYHPDPFGKWRGPGKMMIWASELQSLAKSQFLSLMSLKAVTVGCLKSAVASYHR